MKTALGQEIRGKSKLATNLVRHKYAYLMVIPILLYYLIFAYIPMYGAIIAFKDYSPNLGILRSPWADMGGLKHFINFFLGHLF